LGQDAALHTQLPLTHVWPAPQGAPFPHAQLPVREQLFDVGTVGFALHSTQDLPPIPQASCEIWLHVGPEQHVAQVAAHPEHAPLALQLSPDGHVAQALPPLPHSPVVVPGWQRSPSQQPDPHETRSQTHAPLRQRCPSVHAAPVPHWHCPAAEQPSARIVAVALHAEHSAPGAPQAFCESGVHTLPAQHPLGHDVASQTQDPCEQCRPAPHAAPVPHRQTPSEEQLSAACAPHTTQVDPAEPHVASERSVHVDPVQHPLGQEVPSHTHRPPAQCCPTVQGVAPPQVHAPAVHPSVVVASHPLHAHAPSAQACPAAHAA
jgi:hypothetical protein